MILDVNRPLAEGELVERLAATDFSACMRELAKLARAERIRVMLDNLLTNSPSALHQDFPPDEARRVLRRLQFHYVPNAPAGSTGGDRERRLVTPRSTPASVCRVAGGARCVQARLAAVAATRYLATGVTYGHRPTARPLLTATIDSVDVLSPAKAAATLSLA